jgi:predicted MarR family transcription regulator
MVRRTARTRARIIITVAATAHVAVVKNTPLKSNLVINSAPNAGPSAQAIDQVARIIAMPRSAVFSPA